MSDNDIQISFTRDEVQTMVSGYLFPAEIRAKFEAALPPEHPEGTIAWVTPPGEHPLLCERIEGMWHVGGEHALGDVFNVGKVEPLRVLADDEIAVKRPHFIPDALRGAIERLEDCSGFVSVPNWLHDVADALDEEAKS